MDNKTLIIIAAITFTLIATLAVTVIIQQQRLKTLTQPRYGFLGKPIVPALAMAIMLGGIGAGVYLVNQQPGSLDPTAKAGELKIIVSKNCVSATSGVTKYELSAVVNDAKAAELKDAKYDLFWSFNVNTENYQSKSENDVTATHKSKITVDLVPGVNKLVLLAVRDSATTVQDTYTEEFNVPAQCI
jgi:hypothetical protein